jgi:hypothetical protein
MAESKSKEPAATRTVWERLSDPFPADKVKYRVGSTSAKRGADKKYPAGTKGQLLAYIDARDVMDRFDEVVGPLNWTDTYRVIDRAHHAVECTLTVTDCEAYNTHSDVGYPNSDSPGEPEPLKAAYSDALKRAAVKFGIGRFLYDLESKWVPIDERGRFDKPSTARKPDSLKAEFDRLIMAASNNNTGDAVKAKWCEFGDMPHDLSGYKRLAEDARSELLTVAGG